MQALFEQDQPADAPVAVLKRMDRLKPVMEIKDIVKGFPLSSIVSFKQLLHLRRDILRRGGLLAADLVGQALIPADCKPVPARIAGAAFQNQMQPLDELLAQHGVCLIDDDQCI